MAHIKISLLLLALCIFAASSTAYSKSKTCKLLHDTNKPKIVDGYAFNLKQKVGNVTYTVKKAMILKPSAIVSEPANLFLLMIELKIENKQGSTIPNIARSLYLKTFNGKIYDGNNSLNEIPIKGFSTKVEGLGYTVKDEDLFQNPVLVSDTGKMAIQLPIKDYAKKVCHR
ncbi:MAG: hypothetical protein J0H83_09220 [Candidatus Melainabacteria bacterium]|nr:hypothetical protein [Candidatus Melainabacteria bacterium]